MRGLVESCAMCSTALLSGPTCTSCGFDNRPARLRPADPKLKARAKAEEQRALHDLEERHGDAYGRSALAPWPRLEGDDDDDDDDG